MKPYKMIQRDVPISMFEMQTYCPAIFAEEPHHSRSDKYTPISTADVVHALLEENFHPYMIGQSVSRDPTQYHTAKHMIRFRKGIKQADVMNEIILINSFNGSSAAKLLAGAFRGVCMNGLIAGKIIQEVSIPHRGQHLNDYIEGAYTIVNQFETVDEHRAAMESTHLSYDQAYNFADNALAIRWPDPDKRTLHPDHLLWSRRLEDNKTDLFTIFNRVQENLLKPRVTIIENGKTRSPRKIQNIDDLKHINQSLWDLAEQTLAEVA